MLFVIEYDGNIVETFVGNRQKDSKAFDGKRFHTPLNRENGFTYKLDHGQNTW